MNKDSKEHISQLMDGEIGGDTGRFVLRQLEASGELRDTWARYHLIRDCMRYQDRGLAGGELSDRVRSSIDQPATPAEIGSTGTRVGARWLRPVAGLAIAASVALMAVVAVTPNLENDSGFGTEQISAASAQPFASPNILSGGPETRPVNLNGGAKPASPKMNSYLLRHYQVAGSSAGNGFISFVPIVTSKSAMQNDEAAESIQSQSEIESDPDRP
ncbi:MAG TPA: sigma-E factor negative regulatory protein [Xanthomonadales bacterium]|nr:sigma-E factor negative regulatory protein [Xanthomonadales bacterium]